MAAKLATSAAQFCQRIQELYPHLHLTHKQSEQSSPFRRWTTGSGAGSSYRHHDPRNMYNKQMSEGSTPVSNAANGNGCGGVARWSLGLEQLLADPAGAAAFAHFLSKEFAAENIRFWWSCEQYRQCADGARREALARAIWERHLAERAPEPVNVDAGARRAAAAALRAPLRPAPDDLFHQAQKQIFNVMKFDSYPRFLRSAVHAECARADLRGLPPPYAPAAAAAPAAPAATADTPAKLKKSASNASERRRSGGTSLLPWKLRPASRDRSAGDRGAATPPPHVTDVVKSSQTCVGGVGGAGALCRVVLPDGATSVVGVEPALPVRRLVERLLRRRNLPAPAYDVLLLADDGSGAAQVVDASLPSSVLGGREARVERRCVVRVQLQQACVAVRCRPQRLLRHVLRPVLQRYGLGPASSAPLAPLVLRDGRPLALDTCMQELDGARLQIVLMPEGAEIRNNDARSERDEDTDSLSDLAVRLQDDGKDVDAQSGASSTSRSECGSSCSVGAAGAAAGGAAGAAGRVRAALRPGPPLHHHPPDFLDNLRETQRQRLQGKSEPTPTPRSPPPLPPKPTPRQTPTVV